MAITIFDLHDSMRFSWITIPAGEFLRGSDRRIDPDARDNETPQRRIYLPAYEITRVPVTNAQYKVFVEATGHNAPKHWVKGQIPQGTMNHPVVCVTWHDAVTFCRSVIAHLPTEAEWEKAARGTDGRIYPWGNNGPDKTLTVYYDEAIPAETPVGSYPAGASPYGVRDMGGLVWEWINDWYQSDYYAVSPSNDPRGPAKGTTRVLRGGSMLTWDSLRSAYRHHYDPDSWSHNGGFRCARML